MKRVSVIGCCGVGKSTFSKRLSREKELPLIHLDREYWSAGWSESDPKEFSERVQKLCDAEEWVIDGHYFSTMSIRLMRSDTIFYLDYSTRISLFRTIRRTILNYVKDREDCAEGCAERFNLEFLLYVMRFRSRFRKRTFELIQRNPHLDLFVFRNPREAAAYFH